MTDARGWYDHPHFPIPRSPAIAPGFFPVGMQESGTHASFIKV